MGPLLMDEGQTGGGSTGKMWCHEHFDLEHGPDAVTFSKKMLSGGIYHKKTLRPAHPGRVVNTWVGDPHKALMLEAVVKEIKTHDLTGLSLKTGDTMLKGLKELERRFPGLWHAARGRGTFAAVDCSTVAIRDEIVTRMRSQGVLIGGCGEKAIRIRPALIFEPKHAEIMLEKFEDVLTDLEKKTMKTLMYYNTVCAFHIFNIMYLNINHRFTFGFNISYDISFLMLTNMHIIGQLFFYTSYIIHTTEN